MTRVAKLQKLVESRASRIEKDHGVSDFLVATECLTTHMIDSDWELLDDLNRLLEYPPTNSTLAFEVLLDWILDEPYLPDHVSAIPRMTRKEKKKAEKLGQHLKAISKELGELFPELTKPYSTLRLITQREQTEKSLWVGQAGAQDDEDEATATSFDHFDLPLNDDSEGWGHIQRTALISRYEDLEAPLIGDHGVLNLLQDYMQRKVDDSLPKQNKRKNPKWCNPAIRELWARLNKSVHFLAGDWTGPKKHKLLDVQKYRIIEYATYAYADYHGLEIPAAGWGPKEIQRIVSQGSATT